MTCVNWSLAGRGIDSDVNPVKVKVDERSNRLFVNR